MFSLLPHLRRGLTLGTLAASAFSTVAIHAQEFRNTAKYNLDSGIGLKGFDPVSFFPEGGKFAIEPVSREHQGVTYNFLSELNKDVFIQNPDKYEPTYGAWCAFAMASGSQVDVNPTIYTINGNRIHFFVSKKAKELFDADIAGFENKADKYWKEISGETPRK